MEERLGPEPIRVREWRLCRDRRCPESYDNNDNQFKENELKQRV